MTFYVSNDVGTATDAGAPGWKPRHESLRQRERASWRLSRVAALHRVPRRRRASTFALNPNPRYRKRRGGRGC